LSRFFVIIHIMLGYFGKSNFVATPPAATPASTPTSVPAASARVVITTSPVTPTPRVPQAEPAVQQPAPPSEIEIQLAQLRQSVEAKKLEKDREVSAVQEMQRKQAEYGRDTRQIKPKQAGYSTEAEKIMGGGTGYYAKPAPLSGLGNLGATTAQVATVTGEVTRLTNVVKQLTKDVEVGMVPRSELEKAIKQLQDKSQEAKTLTSQLSDWTGNLGGSEDIAWKLGKLLALLAIGYGVYRLISRKR
jgi:hypothetical protein